MIEGFDQAHTIVMCRNKSTGSLENSRKVGAPEIGHAQDAQSARGVVANGVYRHNMGVLKSGENLRFIAIGPRNLDGHKPPAQVDFFGEVDARKCPTPKLCDNPKTRQLVSRLRQRGETAFLGRNGCVFLLLIGTVFSVRWGMVESRPQIGRSHAVGNRRIEREGRHEFDTLARPPCGQSVPIRVGAVLLVRTTGDVIRATAESHSPSS